MSFFSTASTCFSAGKAATSFIHFWKEGWFAVATPPTCGDEASAGEDSDAGGEFDLAESGRRDLGGAFEDDAEDFAAAFLECHLLARGGEALLLHFDVVRAGRGVDFGGFAIVAPVDCDRLAVDQHFGIRLADTQHDCAIGRADFEYTAKQDDAAEQGCTGDRGLGPPAANGRGLGSMRKGMGAATQEWKARRKLGRSSRGCLAAGVSLSRCRRYGDFTLRIRQQQLGGFGRRLRTVGRVLRQHPRDQVRQTLRHFGPHLDQRTRDFVLMRNSSLASVAYSNGNTPASR